MSVLITTAVLGLLLIIIGILNMMGNIHSVHWYHRRRVTEENVRPFGKLVGLGTVIIGIAAIVFGTLSFVYEKTQLSFVLTFGTVILIVGIIVGMILNFYAMIKYNKGIF